MIKICIVGNNTTTLLVGLKELAKLFNGDIIVELDCLSLVQALEPQTVNKSRLFSVTCDIKEALKHFKSHQINWVCRDQSKFAHCLADWASR
uniref:RNase H type-1 domain-containing protein n=1 Tax=Triticum urartu TaxID=4572 RepID=A0A8R7R7I2_TRIUA